MKPGNKKMKKNAFDPVDMTKEKSLDPKYKTELCKSFEETKFCPYGNKCRFAHGKHELFDKNTDKCNYKTNLCKAFYKDNYCLYGSRCLFKHSLSLQSLDWSYFSFLLLLKEADYFTQTDNVRFTSFKRLSVFSEVVSNSLDIKSANEQFININANTNTVVGNKQVISSNLFNPPNQRTPNENFKEKPNIIKIKKSLFKSRTNSNNETMSSTSGFISPIVKQPDQL